MRFPPLSLTASYHDGGLESVEIGPRREIDLVVALDPVWNSGDGTTRRLRFSAIQNFDEVASFFQSVLARAPERQGAYLDTVLDVVRMAKRVIGVELAHAGYVELHGAKVTEG